MARRIKLESAFTARPALRMTHFSARWSARALHSLAVIAKAGGARVVDVGRKAWARGRGRGGAPADPCQPAQTPSFEAAVTRCLPIEGAAYVLFWGYRQRAIVLRTLKLSDPALIERAGFRTKALEVLNWPRGVRIDALVALTDEEVRELLCLSPPGGAPDTQAASEPLAPSSTNASAKGAAPVQVSQPLNATKVPQDQSSGQGAAPAQSTTATARRDGSPRRRVVDKHEGVFKASGVFVRTMGERRFEQFALDLVAADTGATVRLWGTDLHRALCACAAQAGDLLRVEHNGYSRMALADGAGHTTMKHYTIEVLERRT